jgi:hypothetical protein
MNPKPDSGWDNPAPIEPMEHPPYKNANQDDQPKDLLQECKQEKDELLMELVTKCAVCEIVGTLSKDKATLMSKLNQVTRVLSLVEEENKHLKQAFRDLKDELTISRLSNEIQK